MATVSLLLTWAAWLTAACGALLLSVGWSVVRATLETLRRVLARSATAQHRLTAALYAALDMTVTVADGSNNAPTGCAVKRTTDGGLPPHPATNVQCRAVLGDGQFCNYRLHGRPRAQLVLLLPGLPFDGSQWTAVAEMLAAHGYAALTLDYFGSGASDRLLPERVSAECYADQVVELLDVLGFSSRPLTVCAYGQGAVVALQLAADNPERVSRLILVSPGGLRLSPFNPLRYADQALKSYQWLSEWAASAAVLWCQLWCLLLPPVRHLIYEQFTKRQLSGPSMPLFFMPRPLSLHIEALDRQLCAWQNMAACVAVQDIGTPAYRDGLAAQLHTFPLHGPESVRVLKSVRNHPKKVLLLCGDSDPLFTSGQLRRYLELLPQAHALVVGGASHCLPWQCPTQVFHAVSQFIGGGGGGESANSNNNSNGNRHFSGYK